METDFENSRRMDAMPWLVGIDEAGYGPNLGPLVMSAVACQVPDELADVSLWQVLRAAVRRSQAQHKTKLLIEDSKIVYSTARGLTELERGVLATQLRGLLDFPCGVAHSVELVCPHAHDELRAECWYTGTTPLPVSAELDDCRCAAERFHRVSATHGIVWHPVRSEIVCPTRFNALLDHWQSKAAILGEALASLLRHRAAGNGDNEPVTILIDKHGGRNNYAALLQHALPDTVVQTECEGAECSRYRLHGLGHPMRVLFAPRADSAHFCVALASMVSKYLREVLMNEFNAFWLNHVPGLRPTAGYPADSTRFFGEIESAIEKLALSRSAIWRER
jgi:ribonuclease HII